MIRGAAAGSPVSDRHETISPADPNVHFPLEENARAQSAEDSLDARENETP